MSDLSPAGAGPLVPIGGIGDHSVAVALAGGIAAALYRRSVTGEGDKVDVSLLRPVFLFSVLASLTVLMAACFPQPL